MSQGIETRMEFPRPIVVRGGGDLATGTIHRLCKSGYQVVILETARPTAIRRKVAFCEAVYEGTVQVEGMNCTLASDVMQVIKMLEEQQKICRSAEAMLKKKNNNHFEPILFVDENAESLSVLKPDILIDAILAKRNLGTEKEMANLVIGLGPGFTAGVDVDYVIETMRGHNLGRIIEEGSAAPNTGIPGMIAGVGAERVIHAPADGVFHKKAHIADIVKQGDVLGIIEKDGLEVPVLASIDGVLRGILRDNFCVHKGLKMADIDPRLSEVKNCFTISDKARCIAGSVLELVAAYENRRLFC